MTAPIVGQVAVEVISSARALAKSLKKEVESAFRDLDLNKLIRDSIGGQKVKLPVEADFDTRAIPEKVRRTRVPKVPVELDPVTAAFQRSVKAQVTALSRQTLKIPLDVDGGRLRAEIGAELAAVQAQSKIKVPTEPGAKAAYETKLKAQLAEVAARVKQHVPVDVDVDKGGVRSAIGGLLQGIAKGLPSIGGISSAVASLGGSLQQAAGSSAQLGGNLAGAAESATGPIGVVIGLLVTAAGAMAALAGAATLAVPAMSAVAGAAAAIPAALVGVGAVFGTLGLGLHGISEAFAPKKRGGGGGGGQSPAAQARQIAAAERGVEGARRGIATANRALASSERGYQQAVTGLSDAQKRALTAQAAVNKARQEAVEDLDDLSRSLRGARLDEEGAALGVTEALRNLNEVKLSGNLPDIQRADLAYRQAQLTLENASDSAQDLGEQQADAAKKGVAGSDKVVAALDAQAQAQQGVKDAQNGILAAQDALASANDGVKSSVDALASAQDSLASAQTKVGASGGAATLKLIPLAASAQKFVAAVKALKPAFEKLRLDVQQRLFEGLDKTVATLGREWIPRLHDTLGRYAETFNGFFRKLGASVTDSDFMGNIQVGAEGARQGLEKIGTAVTTSLVPAFGALVKAAGPFLSDLGGEIAGIVTEFSKWVLEGEKTGGLKTFFDTAARSMHDLFDTGKLVGKIVGDLFSILTGSQFATGKKTPLESFNAGLTKIHKFLDDPKNQAKIKGFLDDLKAKLEDFGHTVDKIDGWVTKIQHLYDSLFPAEAKTRANAFGGQIGTFLVTGLVAGIGAAIKANFLSIAGIAQSIVDLFKSIFGIKSPSTVMAGLGVNLIEGLIQGIRDSLPNLFGNVKRIPGLVKRGLGNLNTLLTVQGRQAGTSLRDGITAVGQIVTTAAAGLKGKATAGMAGSNVLLTAAGAQMVTGLRSGINSQSSGVSSTAAGLKTTAKNGFSSPENVLYRAGQAMVEGLKHGMEARKPSLGSYLGGLAVFIANNKGPIEKDRRLLIPQGAAIMDGLISGIDSRRPDLGAQLADLGDMVGATTFPELAGNLGSVSGSLSKASTWEASWAPGMTGDKILDAIRGTIKFKHGGSVDRAFSTA